MIEDLTERWYAIYPSYELRSKPIGLLRFGERFVLWRKSDGSVAALPEACPHRRVSLSLGRVVDDCIECPFHGFRFADDGSCTAIPAHGSEPVPAKYRSPDAPPVAEAHGYIWMWRGARRDVLPPIPWFEQLEGLRPNRGFSSTWSVHYSRAIENQLDFTHLPFVHATTIGRGTSKAMEVECEVSDDWIRGRQVGDDAYAELRFPNVWMLRITDKLAMQAAFFPVDETTSVTHIRAFQGFVRLPGLAHLVGWLMTLNNRRVLAQDQRVVESTTPVRFEPGTREMLVPSDAPVLAYRRLALRERKAAESKDPAPHVMAEALHRRAG